MGQGLELKGYEVVESYVFLQNCLESLEPFMFLIKFPLHETNHKVERDLVDLVAVNISFSMIKSCNVRINRTQMLLILECSTFYQIVIYLNFDIFNPIVTAKNRS